METNISHQAVADYAQRFAADFIKRQQTAIFDGQQLLKLTDIEQVNMFVLQRIFTVWQKEAMRIQSPYFDYSNEEVRKALGHLLNVLSRHISVDKERLQQLLAQAVEDTLLLALSPADYFRKFCGEQLQVIPVPQYLRPALGYLRLHRPLVQRLQADCPGHGEFLEREQAFSWIQQTLDATPASELSDDQAIIGQLDAHLPLKRMELMEQAATSFFDMAAAMEPAVAVPQPPQQEAEPAPSFFEQVVVSEPQPAAEVSIPMPEQPSPAPEKPKAPEVPAAETAAVPPSPIRQHPEKEEQDATISNSLHALLSQQQKQAETLLDKLRGQQPQQQPLKGHLSLNKRFFFQKELFGGKPEELDRALELVDSCQDYHTALEQLKTQFGKPYGWDYFAAPTVEFLALVDQKF